MHRTLLVPVLLYGSETIYGRRMRKLELGLYICTTSRGLLDIRRMDRVQNAWIRESCGVTKRINERIDESIL